MSPGFLYSCSLTQKRGNSSIFREILGRRLLPCLLVMTMQKIHPENLIRDWQEPLFNLSRRMLGNEADALDATQEIFTILLCNLDRIDPSRETGPWIYRVATREIYRFMRRAQNRDKKEHRAAIRQEIAPSIDPAEKRELEGLIQEGLNDLEPETRAALVLHFLNGLSQTEVAAALDIPRTTVQSRLQSALLSVKKRLVASGYVAGAPIEDLLSGCSLFEVPLALKTSLSQLAVSSLSGTAVTSATLGGVIVSKTVILGSVGMGLLGLLLGLTAGRFVWSEGKDGLIDEESRDSSSPILAGDGREFAHLQESHQDALREIQALKDQIKLAGATFPLTGDETDALAQGSVPSEKAEVGSGIEWSRFSNLLISKMDAFIAIVEAQDAKNSELKNQMTPQMQTLMMEFMTESMRVTTQAKTLSRLPFLEESILSELLTAVVAGPLGMTPDQQGQLTHLSSQMLKRRLDGRSVDDLGSLEALVVRREIVDELLDSLPELLSGDQRNRWHRTQPISSALLNGNVGAMEIGIQGGGEDDPGPVVSFWKERFYLTEEQQRSADLPGLAQRYLQDAQQILESYGQLFQKPSPLEKNAEALLERELLALQLKMENQVHPLLTPAQISMIEMEEPRLLRFYFGSGVRNLGVTAGLF